MTGEQIVGITTEELEAMSDEQLLAYFQPILKITRPELKPANVSPDSTVKEARKKTSKKSGGSSESDLLAQLLTLAKQQGLEL
jgi:hypothetical protein